MAQTSIRPGTYVREGGSGVLDIQKGKNGSLRFSIESIGINAHVCGLEGLIYNGKAVLEGDEASCAVYFDKTKEVSA